MRKAYRSRRKTDKGRRALKRKFRGVRYLLEKM
jgi:hypothetical protein